MSRMFNLTRRFSSSGALKQGGLMNELKRRGLISQISQPESAFIEKLNAGEKFKIYCGADPTAKSLHLGNMVPLMVLLNFYVRGHDVVSLVGGATGRVGDPSGRSTERNAMASEVLLDNITRINGQLRQFFENGLRYYQNRNGATSSKGKWTQVDNYDWWKDVSMLEFLAKYGRHIRIQSMLSRDSVSNRLSSSEGLGFNEFTYQVLQAYDFYHLYKERGVTVQVGGNDQWGNITAGIDLINRVSSDSHKCPPMGLTVPLLTTASGEKFGKSAGNAVFIDPELNTAYDIYQFFYNTPDADVSRFLKIFTLLPLDDIESIVEKHLKTPHLRAAQKLLAAEVTELLHGPGSGKESGIISDIIFGDTDVLKTSSADSMIGLFEKSRIMQYAKRTDPLLDVLCRILRCSKSEARRKLAQGSVYLGVSRSKVSHDLIDWAPHLIEDKLLILRIGRQKCFLIKMD